MHLQNRFKQLNNSYLDIMYIEYNNEYINEVYLIL